MSEIVFNYAVLRFLPYRETGEFVNVGVMAFCPQVNYFDYRLLDTRGNRRVWGFFPELDRPIYAASVEAMKRELERHRRDGRLYAESPTTERDAQMGMAVFEALARRRESLLHFAEPRTMLVKTEPEKALRKVYEDLVNRAFAKPKVYQEEQMKRRLSKWLKEWHLSGVYKSNVTVGDDDYNFRLPFVRLGDGTPAAAIKPFDLMRSEPTAIYEHGDAWIQRMRRLRERKTMPERMIFAVRKPEHGKVSSVADEICEELRETDAIVVPFDDRDKIHDLAKSI